MYLVEPGIAKNVGVQVETHLTITCTYHKQVVKTCLEMKASFS
jgi:hypothetical protein